MCQELSLAGIGGTRAKKKTKGIYWKLREKGFMTSIACRTAAIHYNIGARERESERGRTVKRIFLRPFLSRAAALRRWIRKFFYLSHKTRFFFCFVSCLRLSRLFLFFTAHTGTFKLPFLKGLAEKRWPSNFRRRRYTRGES